MDFLGFSLVVSQHGVQRSQFHHKPGTRVHSLALQRKMKLVQVEELASVKHLGVWMHLSVQALTATAQCCICQ